MKLSGGPEDVLVGMRSGVAIACTYVSEQRLVVKVYGLLGEVVIIDVVDTAQRYIDHIPGCGHPRPYTLMRASDASLDYHCVLGVVGRLWNELEVRKGFEDGSE